MENQEESYLALIEEHQGTLQRICKAYSTDREEARDLFQDVLAELWKSYAKFRGESSRYTWMYRITLYTAMNHHRRRKHHPTTSLKEYIPVTSEPAEEGYEELNRAIRRLDEKDRALIVLYLEERTYGEMAEIIGITPNHIGVRLNRIKNKLRDWIKKQPL